MESISVTQNTESFFKFKNTLKILYSKKDETLVLEYVGDPNSSIVLAFLNPTFQLWRSYVTAFCMQLENQLSHKCPYLSSQFSNWIANVGLGLAQSLSSPTYKASSGRLDK